MAEGRKIDFFFTLLSRELFGGRTWETVVTLSLPRTLHGWRENLFSFLGAPTVPYEVCPSYFLSFFSRLKLNTTDELISALFLSL